VSDRPKPYCIELGRVLRDMRHARGLGIQDAASILGISASSLSRYETGGRRPTFSTLVKMAEFYRISVFLLLLMVARATWPETKVPDNPDGALLWVLLYFDKADPS
jgi:transcriptional regulator with XRE-family HTH domain